MEAAAVPIALGAQAATPIVQGLMANAQAKAQASQQRANAFVAETRAMQADTVARQGLNDELGSMRAVFGANQDQPTVGSLEVMNELRRTRERERRITYGGNMQQAYDQRLAAANSRYGGRMALLGGVVKSAGSMFDLYQYNQGPV